MAMAAFIDCSTSTTAPPPRVNAPSIACTVVSASADSPSDNSSISSTRGLDRNARQSGGFTPLLYASRQGCLECVRKLVAAGAVVDGTDPDGITPILSALLNAHFDTGEVTHPVNIGFSALSFRKKAAYAGSLDPINTNIYAPTYVPVPDLKVT